MFNIVFIIGGIIFVATFAFVIVLMFSPKARGKMLSRQIKATNYAVDESKEDLKNISTNISYATKDGIEITSRAIKKGLTEDENNK